MGVRKGGPRGDFRIFDPNNQNGGLALNQHEKKQVWRHLPGSVRFVTSAGHSGSGLKSGSRARGMDPYWETDDLGPKKQKWVVTRN